MKKISSYFMLMLFSIMSFTSCLDGENKDQRAYVGVIDYKGMTCVLKTNDVDLYSPELSSSLVKGDLQIGDCLWVYFTIDYDLAENTQAMIEANGYATVTVNGYAKFDKHYVNSMLTDTTTLRYDEIAVSDPLSTDGVFGLYENYMFVTHVVNQPENLEMSADLSYDISTMAPVEEGDNRYYDLYLRVSKTNTSTGTASPRPYYTAYYMGSYLQSAAENEKALLGSSYNAYNSTFIMRIHYVSEIKDEGEIVWKSKEITMPIANFLSQN